MGGRRRIISLVPSLTEALVDLGVGDRIVGMTDYCPLPPGDAAPHRVGGPRTPDREGIAALAPDLVVAGREESTADDVAWLARNLSLELFSCCSYADGVEAVRRLGALIDEAEAAEGIARRLEDFAQDVAAREVGVIPVFYPIWKDPWMTVSTGTFVSSMLALAGGRSVFADRAEPYPVVTLEEARDRRPERVLLPDEPWAFGPGDEEGLRAVLTYRGLRVSRVPGRWAAWYGTRADEGLAGLLDAIQGG